MNNRTARKTTNPLFLIIAVLPPFIFMFHLFTKNSEYINYWHVLILTLIFAIGGGLFYLLAARAGKSPQGAALASVFLWVMFFTLHSLYRYSPLYNSKYFNRNFRLLILLVLVTLLTISIFYFGRRLRKIEIFKILVVFEIAVFLLNFSQATILLISKKTYNDSDSNYKTSFSVAVDSPSPNIYWLFMDGMLGFKAMDYFFDDPQTDFETQLANRGFLVNRDAEFEIGHATAYAIPALMCPLYYDTVMFSLLASINPDDYHRLRQNLSRLSVTLNNARINNELIAAFNAKNYQSTIIAGTSGYYFHPTTRSFYLPDGKTKNNNPDIAIFLSQLSNLVALSPRKTEIVRLLAKITKKYLHIVPVTMPTVDISSFYTFNKQNAWYGNSLADIFEGPQPRLTIVHDGKAHCPFVLDENGSRINRTENEGLDIYNYPPQHRFTRKYLVSLIDFILAHDPDAVIVVQADHGLHDEQMRTQLLASGGTPEEVRLMQNQTMSAVRIPEKWGGLEKPLDPLNITRLLVNRYVGENYTLLESHP